MNLRAIFFVPDFVMISLSKPQDLKFIGAFCLPDFHGRRSLNLRNAQKAWVSERDNFWSLARWNIA